MDALQAKFDEFVSNSKSMETEMDDALQAAQQKVLKLSKKNSDLTEKYNELTETYNSLQSAYEELNEQLNNLQSVTVATETYNELTETYNSLTTEYERMQTELQEAVVERSNVEADYTNRYNELTETYNNLVTEYESLQEQYETALKEKDDKKEEENAGLVEQYNSLTEVYNSLTEEYEKVTEDSQRLKGELQRRIDNDSSINNYEQLIADLEAKVRELTSSRDKLSINLQQTEKEKSLLTTDNNSLKSQLKEAIDQKNATNKMLDEEKQRLESTTSDATQLRNQLSTKIASLETELQSDKRRIEELLVEKKRLEDLPPPPAPAPVVVEVPLPPPVQVITQEVVHTTVVRPYITMTSTVFDTDFYQSLLNSSNATDRLLTSLVETGDSERLKVALVNSVHVYQDLKRRNLTNLYKLSKLRNTMHVCCRVRPLSDDELKDSNGNANGTDNSIIEIVSDQLLAVTKGSELIPFELDTVWGYDANQADVFEDVEPLIAAVASGMMDGLRSNDHLRGCLCLSVTIYLLLCSLPFMLPINHASYQSCYLL
jgi:myosin heavy subunit